MVWLCVTFKFVCFDGIEGKKLAEEVVREKRERNKENKKRKRKKESSVECSGVWRKWQGKKRKEVKKEKSNGTCVEEKKREKKKKEKKKEIWMKKNKEIKEK